MILTADENNGVVFVPYDQGTWYIESYTEINEEYFYDQLETVSNIVADIKNLSLLKKIYRTYGINR